MDPKASQPRLELARFYSSRKEFDKAQAQIEKAIELNPDDANLYIVLGSFFLLRQQQDEAEKAYLAAIDVNPDTLAFDIIKAVGPGGHFLDKDHTFDHFRTEFYQPRLANRDDFVTWHANGSPQSLVTANLKVKEILNNYEAPELPADVDKDLQKFIAKLG